MNFNLVLLFALIAAPLLVSAAAGGAQEDMGRRGLKAYSGQSSGAWGSVTTKDNGDGTSTTCTNTAYYKGCTTYPNGEKSGKRRALKQVEGDAQGDWGSVTTTDNGDGTSTTTTNTDYYQGSTTYDNGQGRKLKQVEGESSGAWGSVTTTDNGDGTSTTTTNTDYYQGSTTYDNGQGRKLKQVEGESSGSWGSVTTTDNGDGTSTTTTDTPYYQGSSSYPNEESSPAGRRKTLDWGGYSGSWSGSWGSSSVNVEPGGASSGSVNTPYYSGSWGNGGSSTSTASTNNAGNSGTQTTANTQTTPNTQKAPAPAPVAGTVWYNGDGVLVQQLANGQTQTVVNTPNGQVNTVSGK